MSETQVSKYLTRVESVLAEAIHRRRDVWVSQSAYTSAIFDEIELLVLGGGKRIRPQFCYWGWVSAGGKETSDVPVRLGAAVELLHAMALFHDDVIDDSATRRGHTTAHRRHSHTHASLQLLGEARRFGEGVAILIGDITSVIADELVSDVDVETRVIWNELRFEMNIGQFLDTVGAAFRERSASFAETVCRNKTAKYTIERPLHLGAFAANNSRARELQTMLSGYGLPLGDAFQIRDDLLDAFGDENLTGKPVGGDFREGKPTLMLAYAYEKANDAQKAILDRVGHPDLTAIDIAAIVTVLEETGTRNEMEKIIGLLSDSAVSALQKEELDGDAYSALVDLAKTVTQRDV